jgi:hypothetical protein
VPLNPGVVHPEDLVIVVVATVVSAVWIQVQKATRQ